MNQTLTYSVHQTLVTVQCHQCSIVFAMPESLNNECKKDHSRSFFCPRGHGAVYTGPTEAQKLRDRLAGKQAEVDRQRARADHGERRAAAARGQVTKIKKRALRGVCIICNRSFPNVEAHMQSKHAEEIEKVLGHAHQEDPA